MAKRPRPPRSADLHQAYKDKSGWWLAAWRDYANLTLLDMAEGMATSKGMVSDLETGNGPARYNRGWLESAAKALDIPQGYLFDVNPFQADDVLERMLQAYRKMSAAKRKEAADMVEYIEKRDKG